MDNESNITDKANSIDSNSTNSADESTSSKRSKRWRTTLPLIRNGKRKTPPLESIPSAENVDNITDTASSVEPQDDKPKNMELVEYRGNTKRGWHTIVTIVLVEAKGLPEPPDDSGSHHSLYCKFRLGSESQKSKSVLNNTQPEWGERFQLHINKDQLLKVSLWDKGKQKNFMGSCLIDLSAYEKERTHEVWHELDDGFGTIHLSLTLCAVRNQEDNIYDQSLQLQDMDEAKEKYALLNLDSDWKTVGQLQLKLIGAKGLAGKPNAYCTIELDNERVQTPGVRGGSDPEWNKTYLFNVTDVTSTLDLKVLSSSLVRSSFRQETIGKVTIPLLRIQNGEKRWYALKDRSKRNIAKGNCPRVLLEMTMIYNPVKATAKLFRPKEVKYVKKPPKFDVALIYSNMEFIRDTFCVLQQINESFKRLFEWENRQLSFFATVCWVIFWYWFTVWSAPLLMLIPFVYFWVLEQSRFSGETAIVRLRIHGGSEDESGFSDNEKEKTLTGRIQDLPDLTLTITRSVEYMVSLAERLNNLVSFKVPFLSYIVMGILISSSVVLYIVPFNYLLIVFGIYKFSRKYFNPDRILNNDMLDFISRIPDNEILKAWKELNVPEPGQSLHRNASMRVYKSNSIAA